MIREVCARIWRDIINDLNPLHANHKCKARPHHKGPHVVCQCGAIRESEK